MQLMAGMGGKGFAQLTSSKMQSMTGWVSQGAIGQLLKTISTRFIGVDGLGEFWHGVETISTRSISVDGLG